MIHSGLDLLVSTLYDFEKLADESNDALVDGDSVTVKEAFESVTKVLLQFQRASALEGLVIDGMQPKRYFKEAYDDVYGVWERQRNLTSMNQATYVAQTWIEDAIMSLEDDGYEVNW